MAGGWRAQDRAEPGASRCLHPRPGMEVAAYLTEKAHSVSVVELEETPFRRFLGERVGRALMKVSPPPGPSEAWTPSPAPGGLSPPAPGPPALTDV